MPAPEAALYGATLSGNEYGWKPEHFPRALDEAKIRGLACIGGQFHFQLSDGTCEMYWLNADSSSRRTGEPWRQYVTRSVAEVRDAFVRLLQETDFLAEADSFDFLRDKKAKGVNILEALWFVAYFSEEKEAA
jgi:hypothetical protein